MLKSDITEQLKKYVSDQFNLVHVPDSSRESVVEKALAYVFERNSFAENDWEGNFKYAYQIAGFDREYLAEDFLDRFQDNSHYTWHKKTIFEDGGKLFALVIEIENKRPFD